MSGEVSDLVWFFFSSVLFHSFLFFPTPSRTFLCCFFSWPLLCLPCSRSFPFPFCSPYQFLLGLPRFGLAAWWFMWRRAVDRHGLPRVSIARRRDSCLTVWVSFLDRVGYVILHGLTSGGSVVCGRVLLVFSICNSGWWQVAAR